MLRPLQRKLVTLRNETGNSQRFERKCNRSFNVYFDNCHIHVSKSQDLIVGKGKYDSKKQKLWVFQIKSGIMSTVTRTLR